MLAAIGGDKSDSSELLFVWQQATVEAKIIIFCLFIFSIIAWSVMVTKALQMAKAAKLNRHFGIEFKNQAHVMGIFDRSLNVDGCPQFMVYQAGSKELDARRVGCLLRQELPFACPAVGAAV